MKKIFYLLIILLVFISCVGNKNEKELNIYTWEAFIPEEVIENFQNETGIKVNVTYYDTNDVMVSKLLSGVKDYDIVSPSTDFVSILKENNFLEKLDKSKFTNVYENILISKEVIDTYDKDLEYTLPYNIFATGISIDNSIEELKIYVENKDANVFLNANFKGKMTALDDTRELLGLALQSLGYASDSKVDSELEAAKNLIISWKENLSKFENVTYGKGLSSGEFVAVHGYPDVFYEIEDEDFSKYTYYLPKGAMMYIDSMAILKESPNKENAYLFLNYLYQAENYVKVLDKFRTPSVLSNVIANKKPILELEYVLANSTLPKSLDAETKEKHDKIWNEIKLK